MINSKKGFRTTKSHLFSPHVIETWNFKTKTISETINRSCIHGPVTWENYYVKLNAWSYTFSLQITISTETEDNILLYVNNNVQLKTQFALSPLNSESSN